MHIYEVEKLAQFLMNPGLTIPVVCRFLVLETFAKMKASTIYAAEITEDAHISPVGSFGIPAEILDSWGRPSLSYKGPWPDAVRNDRVIAIPKSELYEKYPIASEFVQIPEPWKMLVAVPVLPFGLFSLTLDEDRKISKEEESLLRVIGYLLAINIEKNIYPGRFNQKQVRNTKLPRKGELTERQEQIKLLMEKGLTNPAIAEEIGYSESLVRQETMAIYSVLNITGRKELIEKFKKS